MTHLKNQEAPVNSIASHIIVAMACASVALGDISRAADVVPVPVRLEPREGSFCVTPSTRVVADDAAAEAIKLIDVLAPALGYRLRRAKLAGPETHIRLEIEPALVSRLGEEGYELEVTTQSILLRAGRGAGLFYAAQTLRQLLPPAIFSKHETAVEWIVPCVRIRDYPRFQWRGLLIDPARHFIPVRDVERFIDTMALHKFNRLQIHLTDGQGWRIEIRKYPQLTATGARMDFTAMGRGVPADGAADSEPGAFYTQDDIRHLVRYAAARHITIVPEIEMPAHTGAAALAEALWSPRIDRHYDLFLVRLTRHLERLRAAEVNYRPLDKEAVRWPDRTDSRAIDDYARKEWAGMLDGYYRQR